jgi:hypothetical protein
MTNKSLRSVVHVLLLTPLPLFGCKDDDGGGGADTSGDATTSGDTTPTGDDGGTTSTGDTGGTGTADDGGTSGSETGSETGDEGPNVFLIEGEDTNHRAASIVVGLPDMNGDGLGEVAVGAPSANGDDFDSGRAYVVWGQTAEQFILLKDIVDNDTHGFAIDGVAGQDTMTLAQGLGAAGDVNNDGVPDLVLGAVGVNGGASDSGAAYVVFGKDDNSRVKIADLETSGEGFVITSIPLAMDKVGHAVSGAGDVNGDGFGDLVVSAVDPDYHGKTYVVFGKDNSDPVSLEDIEAGTGNGFVVMGMTSDDRLGYSVAGVGDLNGDGLDDIAAGAPFDNTLPPDGGSDGGRTFVVFGKTDGDVVQTADIEAGTGGYLIESAAGDRSGWQVVALGDMNGDDVPDLAIGAPMSDPAADAGKVFVVFGGDTAVWLPDVAAGTGGYVIEGETAGDRVGAVVGGGDDVDGDGIVDLLIGAAVEDPATDPGKVYVVWGKTDGDPIALADVAGGTGGWLFEGEAGGVGASVDTVPDINGDGLAEVIFGAPLASATKGRAFVGFEEFHL